jgi:hypothetical protein
VRAIRSTVRSGKFKPHFGLYRTLSFDIFADVTGIPSGNFPEWLSLTNP